MRPGPRLARLMALPCAFALLAPWAPGAAWLALLGAALLLAAAGAEWIQLRGLVLDAERPPASVLPLDEEESLALAVRSNAARPARLVVRQSLPGLVEPPSVAREGTCVPGGWLRLEFRVRGVERGSADLPPAWVAATYWGLAERVMALGAGARLTVLPNLRAVGRLHDQLNRFVLRGLGSRTSPRLGKGREFDRLREYHINDDYRDIAWKASARRNKLIVREYRLDRSQDVLLCLDRGHRMASRDATIAKVDHAVNAAVLIAYICQRMEDRVGILSFGASVEKGLGQGRGASHLRQVTAFATALKGEFIHTDYLALAVHVRRRLRHRSLILILTDLPEGDARFALVRAVKMLIPQHLPLVLVLSDPAIEAAGRTRPANREELMHTLVAREMWAERQQLLKDLRASGALVVDTRPQEAGLAGINAYVEVKRRQML